MSRWLIASLVPLALLATTLAVPPGTENAPKTPNADADQAASRAQVADGLKATVWASEPIMMNPVAFAFDEQGAAYVVETTRFDKGVPDTRGHMYWLDEDIGARTVADRLAMYKKHNYYKEFDKFDDQIRKVWVSTTGGKKADTSTIFSKGYNRPEDGLAAGVLARKGNVYLTNIPDLYVLKDTKGEGVADVKKSLATGFGVRVQFIGHDLHGLRMGPDGRLYFSIGDRGLNVVNKEGKKLINTESGAVLRCEPDGSHLEIVHTGLRNPQELAFDDHGNLFTFDNNSDSGDRARWVHIVQGGDSGWRCGYQYGTLMHNASVPQGNRGPWNLEKIWHVPGPEGGPPAYVVPPLRHIGNGPSGITHYPGLGLNDKYKDHFFACDFTSSPGGSKIWDISMKPKGASFEVNEPKPFVSNMVPTDCEFGPDGAFYWSDWVGGWSPPGKGRIFRVEDPVAMKNPAVAEAQKLIAEGFEKKSVEELAKLLEHPHSMVRQEAQFELASRKLNDVFPALVKVTKDSKAPLARLHAVWCLGQLARKNLHFNVQSYAELVTDADPAIRAAVATVVGDQFAVAKEQQLAINTFQLTQILKTLMADHEPRVKARAAAAYANSYEAQITPRRPAAEQDHYAPLFTMLKTNNDQDAYLRQAAVTGLVGITQNPVDLFNAWKLAGEPMNVPAVRIGVVLALRKLHGAKLSEFLNDSDPRIVAEAARAIYDQELMDPMPELAKLADKSGLADVVAYRALAANYKLGTADDAKRIAQFASRIGEQDYLRKFALELLADWPKPPKRDPITGLVGEVVIADRSPVAAAEAVKPVLAKLFAGSNLVREQAVKTTSKLNVTDVGPLMATLINDSKQSTNVRVEALYALDALKAKELKAATTTALASDQPKLRAAARIVNAKANPAAAMKELPELLNAEKASIEEKQAALEALGNLKESKEADTAIAEWLDKYAEGKVPAELKLDVLEAGQTRSTATNLKLFAPLREKLKTVDTAARAAEKTDPLARYRESVTGGDADRGRSIFLNNAAVYCQRCHKLDGQGGDVGPALNGIAAKQNRDYLLEAIVLPNAKIAEGFQSVILTLSDGRTITGVLRAKDAKNYTIVTAENKTLTIAKDDVDSEKPDKSAMPEDLIKKLSKRELRDVLEFLAGLKEVPKKEGDEK